VIGDSIQNLTHKQILKVRVRIIDPENDRAPALTP